MSSTPKPDQSRPSPAPPLLVSPWRWAAPPPWLACAILLIACFALYANSLHNAFHFDDFPDIHQNALVTSPGALLHAFPSSRWLHFATLHANFLLHGTDWLPGWHLVNISLHASCTLLLFTFLRLVTRPASSTTPASPLPFIAALLFALHPLATEPVNYIRARMAILYALFTLLALLGAALAHRATSWTARCFSWSLIILALAAAFLTKEVAAAISLLALAAYAVAFCRGSRRSFLAFFALAATVLPAALLWLHFSHALDLYKSITSADMLRRHLVAYPVIFFRYLLLALFPARQFLNLDHHVPYPPVRWYALSDPDVLAALTALFILFLVAALLKKRHPLATFSILLIPCSMAPYFFVVTVDLLVEYKFYLALCGTTTLFALLLTALALRAPSLATLPLLLAITFCAFTTYTRNSDWRTDLSIWSDAYTKSPRRARTLNAYAWALAFDPHHPDVNRALDLALKSFDKNVVDPWPGFNPSMIDSLAHIWYLHGEHDHAMQMERDLISHGEGNLDYYRHELRLMQERHAPRP